MFRIEPKLPVQAYTTYQIKQARDNTIVSACKDVGCQAWNHGWVTTIDESTELGKAQASYIRLKSGRTFREQRDGAGLTVFTFEPFQRCFTEHKTKPQTFIQRGGDWRGNPRGEGRVHANAGDWVESFAEHQDALKTAIDRG